MTRFVNSATHVHDVESDLSYAEIRYDQYIESKGVYQTYTDYISTEPHGHWVKLGAFKHSIPYEKFLDTMVSQTFEVCQRKAEVYLDSILDEELEIRHFIRILHATKIVDPTFQPPHINKKSAWQVEFLQEFCRKYITDAIQECKSKSRLEYFFNVLHAISLNIE